MKPVGQIEPTYEVVWLTCPRCGKCDRLVLRNNPDSLIIFKSRNKYSNK